MTRVAVVVEGPTEETLLREVLAPVLAERSIAFYPRTLRGNTNYQRVKSLIVRQLKQDLTTYCSTMLDLYGLGRGFPGGPFPENLPSREKAKRLEQAMKADICCQIPDFRPDARFLPYLQLHEYEALLFSDPAAFAFGIGQPQLASRFQQIRHEFPSPEDIDDDPRTAPSKRIRGAYPAYQKVLEGTLGSQAVGVERMRQECPHFHEWVQQLEALGSGR